MHGTICDNMRTYFDVQIAACTEREKLLTQEQRGDEATLARIERNIYEVFRTVWDIACKQGDDAQELTFFRTKLAQIPQNWQTSREAALAHGDAEKAHIEAVKLATAQHVADTLAHITEAAP